MPSRKYSSSAYGELANTRPTISVGGQRDEPKIAKIVLGRQR